MIEEDNEDLNEIEQMIYLNKVYQIKKKIQTLHGYFRMQWHCTSLLN